MYELLILGTLLTGPKSGYLLQHILENSLVPPRKLSNSILYPLLDKLEQNGWIQLETNDQDGRGAKIAHLTAAGEAHFHELLTQPVKADAKRDDWFNYKLRNLGAVDSETRETLLDEFEIVVQQDLVNLTHVHEELTGFEQTQPEFAQHFAGVVAYLDLLIATAQTKLTWVTQQKENLHDTHK